MKRLLLITNLLISISAFATGGFECESSKVTVYGTVGAGDVVYGDVTVVHSDLRSPLDLTPSAQWLEYSSAELKLKSYDAMEDVTRLKLEVNNGVGTLSLNLSDMPGGNDIIIEDSKVTCFFE